MKYINNRYILALSIFLMGFGFTSCINDLDVTPINPSVIQTFDQEGVFTKLYSSLALSGQKGPDGDGDVAGIDEGTSAFVRLTFNLNELTTDEAICSWGDPGIPEMNFNKWSASHDQVKGLYNRLYFNIDLCNQFLTLTASKTDAVTLKERAETRFIRALNYEYLLDMFGNVPFAETVSLVLPKQIKRADLFVWIEKELKECEVEMSEPKAGSYYRADKAANWLLLSRMYLNAEVYTGTARWADAATYAKKVIDSGYTLCPSYSQLFMADNSGAKANDVSTVNNAPNEIIFAISADGQKTKTWGTSLFLIAATHTSGMKAWGTTEGWGGVRARAALTKKFLPFGIPSGADLTDLRTAAADDRAMLFAEERTVEIASSTIFKQGLSVAKYSNIRADGKSTNDIKFTDTDVPLLRKAEAYLTYAEAVTRGAATIGGYSALDAVNALRVRSHATPVSTVTKESLLDEWSREFYFEGRRRIDLIRFGSYGGSDYTWDWKGGSASGSKFASFYNIFPIPASDLLVNPNLTQNTGY